MLTLEQFRGMVYARHDWFISLAKDRIWALLNGGAVGDLKEYIETYLNNMPEANLTLLQVESEGYIAEFTMKVRCGELKDVWLSWTGSIAEFERTHSTPRPWFGMPPQDNRNERRYERIINLDTTRNFHVALDTLTAQNNMLVDKFNMAIQFAEMAGGDKFDRRPAVGRYSNSYYMEKLAELLDSYGMIDYAKIMRNSAVISNKLSPKMIRFAGFKPVWVLTDIFTEVLDLSHIKSIFDPVSVYVYESCAIKELRLPSYACLHEGGDAYDWHQEFIQNLTHF